ncbi:MAG TPA: hypothetical protein VE999_03745 [Gemmataceae bacterium]|nr:hypothetical protein [Bryobacteraceae bacterium]HZV04183.1 hypothetical protein [Gemmataceae bacterium]
MTRNKLFKPRDYVYVTLYLIDGVRVTKRAFEARQIFGEYVGARFEAVEVRRLK